MYQVGWDKQEIKITPKGYAMFGYGQWSHRAYEKRTALYARSFSIIDQQQHRLIICCLDLGCITHAMRSQSMQRLQQILGSQFDENQLVLKTLQTAKETLTRQPTQRIQIGSSCSLLPSYCFVIRSQIRSHKMPKPVIWQLHDRECVIKCK